MSTNSRFSKEQTRNEDTSTEHQPTTSTSNTAFLQPQRTPATTSLRKASISAADDYSRWTDNAELLRWQNEIAAQQDAIHQRRASEAYHAHPMGVAPPMNRANG